MKKILISLLVLVVAFGLFAGRPQTPSITVTPPGGTIYDHYLFTGFVGRVGKIAPVVGVACVDGSTSFSTTVAITINKDGTFETPSFVPADYAIFVEPVICTADLTKFDRRDAPEIAPQRHLPSPHKVITK